MKVGDYVRTRDYGIHKITRFERYDYIEYIVCENQFNVIQIDRNNIIKSSPNIIDLIEVGDYVNGEQIIDISSDDNINNEKLLYYYIPSDYGEDCFRSKDIKSIVTKEQFESMEYKVK